MIDHLTSLKFATTANFEDNLTTLTTLLKKTQPNSFIVAPEVSLTDFAYERFDEAAAFYDHAVETILPLTKERIFVITLIRKIGNDFFNEAIVFHDQKVVKQQTKHKLFVIGDERKFFSAGEEEAIVPIEIDGLKIGVLICFELRFTKLWDQLKGADIIAIPAMWGKPRAEHYETLTHALAIMNQCYVVASDSANEDMTGRGGIITPFGKAERNDKSELLTLQFEAKQVNLMRRYVDVGLSPKGDKR
jgi:predicted amidohydrolase